MFWLIFGRVGERCHSARELPLGWESGEVYYDASQGGEDLIGSHINNGQRRFSPVSFLPPAFVPPFALRPHVDGS